VDSELERLRKKVENYPSASAYNRLAELSRQGGDIAGAIDYCKRCVKMFPRNGQAHVILAEIELANGNAAGASKALGEAIERDPRSYNAHRLMADLLAREGNQAQAVHHLRQILSFKPNDEVVKARLAAVERGVAPQTATMRRVVPATPAATPVAAPPPAVPLPPSTALVARRASALDPLVNEPGVRGAAVIDSKGRVLLTLRLPHGQEDIIAALAAEVAHALGDALAAGGGKGVASWGVTAEHGQVLAFGRAQALSVIALADPGVRPAIIELRARQALIDLGGG
jgi:tetratricopeptide (TPR) repeat protein